MGCGVCGIVGGFPPHLVSKDINEFTKRKGAGATELFHLKILICNYTETDDSEEGVSRVMPR